MKVVKSLILTLVLAGATYAGDMPQFGPAPLPAPPPAARATNNAMAKILAAVIQNLLTLR
jgi:hypothetical protein